MEHIAVLKPKWKLAEKIISGKKTIESRWYMTRRAPWGRIRKGETVYFKEGKYVSVKATVSDVLQTEVDNRKIKELLEKYSKKLGIADIQSVFSRRKNKKYCILVFLADARRIEPFQINRRGFGNMSAWICVDDVGKLKA
jgi:ASC-1-like (ASCH) protein